MKISFSTIKNDLVFISCYLFGTKIFMKNIISVSTLLFCCVYMYAAHVEPSLSRVEPLRELACKAVFANALACKEIQETIENTPLGELSGLETLLDTSYTKRLVASLYPPVMQSESVVLEGHNDWVRCLAINPITGEIVSGSYDKTLRVWNGETRKCVAVLEGHNGWVSCVAINPITGEIVSGSDDKTLRVWQKPSITQEINRYAENEVILAALRIKTHLRNNKKAGIDQLLDDQVEDTKQYLEALQKKRIAFMPH